jgi:hypothetical protein
MLWGVCKVTQMVDLTPSILATEAAARPIYQHACSYSSMWGEEASRDGRGTGVAFAGTVAMRRRIRTESFNCFLDVISYPSGIRFILF